MHENNRPSHVKLWSLGLNLIWAVERLYTEEEDGEKFCRIYHKQCFLATL